jgi:hypothetical protein
VQLHQNQQLATWNASFGLVVWNAAVVITRILESPVHRPSLLGDGGGSRGGLLSPGVLTALDIGAGSGLVGLALGLLGAAVTLTDYEPAVVEQLAANVALNRRRLESGTTRGGGSGERSGGQGCCHSTRLRVHAATLDWVAPSSFLAQLGPAHPGFDLLIASDLLYNTTESTWPELAATLAALCAIGNVGAHGDSSGDRDRRSASARASMVLVGFQRRASVEQSGVPSCVQNYRCDWNFPARVFLSHTWRESEKPAGWGDRISRAARSGVLRCGAAGCACVGAARGARSRGGGSARARAGSRGAAVQDGAAG